MRVSPYALREGVIVDTLAHTCQTHSVTPDLRRSSVTKMGLKFNSDRRLASARHAAELAKVGREGRREGGQQGQKTK